MLRKRKWIELKVNIKIVKQQDIEGQELMIKNRSTIRIHTLIASVSQKQLILLKDKWQFI